METELRNAESLSQLIKDELYEDLEITVLPDYCIVRSDMAKVYAMVKSYFFDDVTITKEDYIKVLQGAEALDYSPLFIGGTADGVFDFALDVISPKFESYTDPEAGIDIEVANLDVGSGVQILEWYPEFSSLDEYLDVLMNDNLDNLEDVPLDFDEDTNV